MKNDNLKQMFDGLQNKFDTELPSVNHSKNFQAKLKQFNQQQNKSFLWKPWLSIAATVTLLVSLFLLNKPNTPATDLASISPEMKKTQSFFATTLHTEIKKLKLEQSPENKQLISDALLQIEQLENEYQNLKKDLQTSNNDQRVIYAMINNYKQRIQLLQQTLNYIQSLKNKSYENEIL